MEIKEYIEKIGMKPLNEKKHLNQQRILYKKLKNEKTNKKLFKLQNPSNKKNQKN